MSRKHMRFQDICSRVSLAKLCHSWLCSCEVHTKHSTSYHLLDPRHTISLGGEPYDDPRIWALTVTLGKKAILRLGSFRCASLCYLHQLSAARRSRCTVSDGGSGFIQYRPS